METRNNEVQQENTQLLTQTSIIYMQKLMNDDQNS